MVIVRNAARKDSGFSSNAIRKYEMTESNSQKTYDCNRFSDDINNVMNSENKFISRKKEFVFFWIYPIE